MAVTKFMDLEELQREKVGTHQALHYDLGKHVMTLSAAPQVDEALGIDPEIGSRRLIKFEGVSDISISSRDNLVIGKVLKFANEYVGGKNHCETVFDDFGKEVLVRFTFEKVA